MLNSVSIAANTNGHVSLGAQIDTLDKELSELESRAAALNDRLSPLRRNSPVPTELKGAPQPTNDCAVVSQLGAITERVRIASQYLAAINESLQL